MKLTILTVNPEMLKGFEENQVVKRAIRLGVLSYRIADIRDYTKGSFRAIDDSPYGGGNGMILRVDAMCNALNTVKTNNSHVILMSPKGSTFNQQKARELSVLDDIVIVCGHYEGIDCRFEKYVDEQLSIGDYILTGGETAAQVVSDAIIRLLPGVMKDGVTSDESFENGMLEYPQYTHPKEYDGMTVPDVLLSGDDKKIAAFKAAASKAETEKFRPDLIKN